MSLENERRRFLKALGTAAGSIVLSGCGAGGAAAIDPSTATAVPPQPTPTPTPAPAPAPVPAPPPPPPKPASVTALQTFLQAKAQPALALPPPATQVPTIDWAGPFNSTGTPATTLPNGVMYPLTDSRFSIPIFNLYSASLPGNPSVAGIPCIAADRYYTCKGMDRDVRSPQVLRLKTDAPVVEFSGLLPDGSGTVQTLIVDGYLVPPTILSSSLGQGGGYDAATIRVDFGSRQMRDIWLQSLMWIAYVKLDQGDTLEAVADSADPQITAVGDSYLQVSSANFANGGAIAFSAAARLGIAKVATDSVGGTGFWNSGGDLGNLNDRLTGHAADNSAIYLIMAGLNDYGDTTGGTIVWPSNAQWEGAVMGYLQGLRAAQPEALIIVCAPFCPVPPMSDSSYVVNTSTNPTGSGDYLYKSALFKRATAALGPPWVFIDVLMGTGWVNSSGATGDATGLQWFTGGTPGPGTSPTYKPGNTQGGGGGGFGGIATVPVLVAGQYSQGPNVYASGGSGSGLMLAADIDSAGQLTGTYAQTAGSGYTSGTGLPTVTIDPTYEITPAMLGTPTLITGINPNGEYPLPSFAPAGVTADQLNNICSLISADLTHPSPLGAEYLAQRLAQNIYDAVMEL